MPVSQREGAEVPLSGCSRSEGSDGSGTGLGSGSTLIFRIGLPMSAMRSLSPRTYFVQAVDWSHYATSWPTGLPTDTSTPG